MLHWVKYLPLELQLFCITPYTYSIQPTQLVHEIRTYKCDIDILDNLYTTQYNDVILLRDLKTFCQIDDIYTDLLSLHVVDEVDIDVLPKCFALWKRHYLHKDLLNSQIYTLIVRFDTIHTNHRRHAMFIWGVLSPTERTMFINAYVLNGLN